MSASTALVVPAGAMVAARAFLVGDECTQLCDNCEQHEPLPNDLKDVAHCEDGIPLGQLTQLNNPLPVGIVPPHGKPDSYALLSRPGSAARSLFTSDYLIRVRVFDKNIVRCERNADLLWGLLLAATHQHIVTPPLSDDTLSNSQVWISKASPGDNGPSSFSDEDVNLFGIQFAIFWTVAGKPI